MWTAYDGVCVTLDPPQIPHSFTLCQGKEVWLQHLSPTHTLEHLIFVASNVLDALCLERCLDAIVALLNASVSLDFAPGISPLGPESLDHMGRSLDHMAGEVKRAEEVETDRPTWRVVSKLLGFGLLDVLVQV